MISYRQVFRNLFHTYRPWWLIQAELELDRDQNKIGLHDIMWKFLHYLSLPVLYFVPVPILWHYGTFTLHGTGTGNGNGTGAGTGAGSMGSNILCRNVHTGLRQGQGPEPIIFYCTSPIPAPPLVWVPWSSVWTSYTCKQHHFIWSRILRVHIRGIAFVFTFIQREQVLIFNVYFNITHNIIFYYLPYRT